MRVVPELSGPRRITVAVRAPAAGTWTVTVPDTTATGQLLAELAEDLVSTHGMDVTVAGRNLFVWTDYSGYDPEVNFFGQIAGVQLQVDHWLHHWQ